MHTNDSLAFSAAVANHSSERGDTMSELLSDPQQTPNHSYTVELRFFGDSLEPSEISRRLNLQPSNSSDALIGSTRGRKIRPFWAYNGQGEDEFQPEWQSLEQGLDFLLRRLAPLRATVIELTQSFEGIWWCGHFQTGFDGGPTLSSKVLAEIARYGLPLFIDNYFASESR